MSRLAAFSQMVNHAAVETDKPAITSLILFAATLVVVMFMSWTMRLVRQAFAPVIEMLRIVASAALAALVVTSALVFLVIALVTR